MSDQMDQNSTITSSLVSESTAPSEPSATRPKPFDDDDAASRKRRRTSVSASPVPSSKDEDIAGKPADTAGISKHDTAGSANQLEPEPTRYAPSTPEGRSPIAIPSSHASSSRVTINLRRPNRSLSPDLTTISTESAVEQRAAEQVKQSIEMDADDLNKLADEDEDNRIEGVDDVAPETAAFSLIDPTDKFPFLDRFKSLDEASFRIANYLMSDSDVDAAILEELQDWIELCLAYIDQVDDAEFFKTCKANTQFWIEFPQVIRAVVSRQSDTLKSSELRNATIKLYVSFAQLAVRFARLDESQLSSALKDFDKDTMPMLSLFSLNYHQQLHGIIDSEVSQENAAEVIDQQNGAAQIMNKLQACPSGSIDDLARLAKTMTELVKCLPRYSDALLPLCQMLSCYACYSRAKLNSTDHQDEDAKVCLERSFDIWLMLALSLENVIEKHVSQLNGEGLSKKLLPLSKALEACLHSRHRAAVSKMEDIQMRYPDLHADYRSEAIAWAWRLDVLIKLVKSTHMQLRVIGVTSICTELVQAWKRLGPSSDDSHEELLRTLGKQLLQTNLIQYIVESSYNPEIIGESANIVGFLAITGLYDQKLADILWNGIIDSQDPRIAESIARMQSTASRFLTEELLLEMCTRFRSLPVTDFTPGTLLLLETVLRDLIAKSHAEQTLQSTLPLHLCCDLLIESSQVQQDLRSSQPELHRICQTKLKELLACYPNSQCREDIYSRCIEGIKEEPSKSTGNLWCLFAAIRPGLATEFERLAERHNIVRLLVMELRQSATLRCNSTKVPVLYGGINGPRRDLISLAIHFKPATLSGDIGSDLWDLLVGKLVVDDQDRAAGWQILTALGNNADTNGVNPFVQTCYERYLPELLPSFFCEGMLHFTREKTLLTISDTKETDGNEIDFASNPGVQSLWRVVLDATREELAEQAIHILVTDVYLDSHVVTSISPPKARQIHLGLIKQCLKHMRAAANRIKAAEEGTVSAEDESLVLVTANHDLAGSEREFSRSLKLMRAFVEGHQARPSFSVADVRSLAKIDDLAIQGTLADLKYQSFDGTKQTAIKTISLGVENTAACLLATLRKETGFDNYSVYFRGKLFTPSEVDIHKSLQELCIQGGLILVKKESEHESTASHIKPGSSFLEIEILAYFEYFWQYLSMSDNIAKEIYYFLTRLPTEGCIARTLQSQLVQYSDLFSGQEPFKALFTLFAFSKLLKCPDSSWMRMTEEDASEPGKLISIILDLTLKALMDVDLVDGTPQSLRMHLTTAMMDTLDVLLKVVFQSEMPRLTKAAGEISHERLLEIICTSQESKAKYHPLAVAKAFRVSLFLATKDQSFWFKLTQDARFEQVVRHLCLLDLRRPLRLLATEAIVDAIKQESQLVEDKQESILNFFWRVTFSLLQGAVQLPHQCSEWFKLTDELLVRLQSTTPHAVDVKSVALSLSQPLLLQHDSLDGNDSSANRVTHTGLINLIHTCIRIDPAAVCFNALSYQLDQKMAKQTVDYVLSRMFWRFLFPMPGKHDGTASDDVIHDEETRNKIVHILIHLFSQADLEHSRNFIHGLNDIVPYFVDDSNDPYSYELPFQFDRSKALKRPEGYVGLVNLSNTCYLNSLLTQLFMNVTFRCFMLSLRLQEQGNSQQLLFHTQSVFGHLQNSIQRSAEPVNFVSSIKTYDDSAIDVHNQMDVDEFYNLLFDRWEGQMPGDREKKVLRSFYGGQLVQQVKSKECEHVSERLDSFSAIQCDIKGKRTLEESLQAYVDGETMEGDNKYKCTSCDSHVDAVKRTCLKDVPDHMIFHLKRFDFNLRTLQRSKINDYFAFPPSIDLHPFTIDHLTSSSEPQTTDLFELVGVLVHTGTAESGHYYSYIRERPSSTGRSPWVEFNDENVSAWDSNQMADMTFGGASTSFEIDGSDNGASTKPYSAYMLFYQRFTSLKKEMEAGSNTPLPAIVPMRTELKNSISRTNNILTRRHYMFDASHVSLVESCCRRVLTCGSTDADANRDGHSMQDDALNLAISFLDQVVSRADGLPDFERFSAMVEQAVTQCGQCALTFFEYFNVRRVAFRCLLQRNPEQQVRKFMAGVLPIVWNQISTKFPEMYFPIGASTPASSSTSTEDGMSLLASSKRPPGNSVVETTVLLFNQLWRYFQSNIRSWDEVFGLVLSFSKRGACETSHVLTANYLVKMFQIITADSSMELAPNFARMLQNVMRRNYGRAVSYKSVLSLMEYLVYQLEPKLDMNTIVDEPEERLRIKEAPFPWTAAEAQTIHSHPGRENGSIFIEKLLSLDKEQCVTDSILSRLISTSEKMDAGFCFTLRGVINAEASTSDPLVPFLRWASLYITKTASTDGANFLLNHICMQIPSFQDGEGAAFMALIRTSLSPGRDNDESNYKIRRHSIALIPDWAPLMLVYPDGQVRKDAEEVLEAAVFEMLSKNRDSDVNMIASDQDDEKTTLEGIVSQIGEKCVAYLIEIHVKQRMQLLKDAAVAILRVIDKCSLEMKSNGAMENQEIEDFMSMKDEVINAVQSVVVDTMDDDLSDWSNSGFSSTLGEEGLGLINTWAVEDAS